MDSNSLYLFLSLVSGIVLAAVMLYLTVIQSQKRQIDELKLDLNQKETEIDTSSEDITNLKLELSKINAALQYAQKEVAEKEVALEKINEKLTKDFENIAHRIVNQSSQVIQQKQEEKLMDMLNPFKDKIEKFENKVEQTHKEAIRDSQSLKEQLLQLRELNKNIGEEAKNLTLALKGDKKIQGDWGEHKLERILQAAGLEKEIHYRKQVNLKDETDANFRPDYIIYLPDNKNLVIDSKVSLVAYERYFNCESDIEAKAYMAQHTAAVKQHILSLSSVNYANLLGLNSPDYVIMYLPLDAALTMALTEDTSLFEYALNKNIVLVSNTTLLATLKTVSFIWQQDKQNKNALEIARQGGALYDKFVTFVETLILVGKKMQDSKKEYDQAMNQLVEGNGNLVRRTENLKALGIKATKNFPENIKNRALPDNSLIS